MFLRLGEQDGDDKTAPPSFGELFGSGQSRYWLDYTNGLRLSGCHGVKATDSVFGKVLVTTQ